MANNAVALQVDHDSLRTKHHELGNMYTEKLRAQARTQKMYDALKKQMLQHDVQSAAADAADGSIHSSQGNQGFGPPRGNSNMYRSQLTAQPIRRGQSIHSLRDDGQNQGPDVPPQRQPYLALNEQGKF